MTKYAKAIFFTRAFLKFSTTDEHVSANVNLLQQSATI
jgi:hypothetical protein